MTRTAFLARLRGPQRTDRGWLAFCPAHDDRSKRSLSVAVEGSRLLVKCFTGCSAQAIVQALGLTLRELFLEGPPPGTAPEPAGDALRVVATYEYRDEAGQILYRVVRFEPKDFRPQRPDGRWGLGDVRRVLYRLPDLAEQTRVHLVEGEKDADRLWSLGLAAATSQGGAQAWRDEYAQQLVDAGVQEVVLLPDHDEPGEQYAAAVARACLARGLRVKVVRLPDLPTKGDVSEWLDAGHPTAELQAVIDAVPWGAGPPVTPALGMVHVSTALDTWLEAVEHGAPPFLRTPFPGLNHLLAGGFAPGELVYLGARAGVGKTAFALELARAAARDGHGVIVVSREMVALALARRLLAQGARVHAAGLKTGRISDAEWVLIRDALPKLRMLPLWFADRVTTIQEITRLVEGYAEAPPLGLLVVDYLQLVRVSAPCPSRPPAGSPTTGTPPGSAA